MTFHRIVDGKPVALTAEEAAPYAAGTKRHRMKRGLRIVFTDAEEAARDAEESQWMQDAPKREAEIAKARLAQIDAASIRAMREHLASLPDAPKAIKDREAEAVAEREKLK